MSATGCQGKWIWKDSYVTYVISQSCVDLKDKACVEECPVDCIYEGERMLYIHPDECVDCGACEPVCPVESCRSQAGYTKITATHARTRLLRHVV